MSDLVGCVLMSVNNHVCCSELLLDTSESAGPIYSTAVRHIALSFNENSSYTLKHTRADIALYCLRRHLQHRIKLLFVIGPGERKVFSVANDRRRARHAQKGYLRTGPLRG